MNAIKTVMVIDDDQPLRESVCELLEDKGYRALCVDGGAAALALLRRSGDKPDLVLLDLMMPGMTGWQFREAQLRDPALASIPVVVLTASRDLRGIEADAVVYKPLKTAKLLDVVGRYAGDPAFEQAASQNTAIAASEVEAASAFRGSPNSALAHSTFGGGGEASAWMRRVDWAKTPLGAIETWPRSLIHYVKMILELPSPAIIFWGNEQTQIYNDGYSFIMGPRHPKYFGAPYKDCWPDTYPFIYPMMQKVLEHGEAIKVEKAFFAVTRHGFYEEAYFTFSFSAIRDDAGAIAGIIQPINEVTDTVLGERRAETLRALVPKTDSFNPTQDAIHALSTNPKDIAFALIYRWDDANKQLKLAGCTENLQACEPDLVTFVDSALQVVSDGRALQIDDVEQRLSGKHLGPWEAPTRSALVVPMRRSASEAPRGAVVFGISPALHFDDKYRGFMDVAAVQVATSLESAHALREAQERAAALAELDRAKTAFFSNVSHEFRTPLTLMLGPAHDLLVGEHGPLADEQRHELEVLHRNGLRLQKLVNALLEFSRLEAGRANAFYEPLDLAATTRELASAFESAITSAGLALTTDLAQPEHAVYVDRDMWEKIVLNLLSNALKFTFDGGIHISLCNENDTVVLRVKDSGVGIPAEELPRLFERFHRVEGMRSRTHEGSGIGLALVQELVKLHGGTIHVESALGIGSTFAVAIPTGTVHLPKERIKHEQDETKKTAGAAPFVQEAIRWIGGTRTSGANLADTNTGSATDAERVPAALARPARSDNAVPRRRILLADDNADMRDYVRRHLEVHFDVDVVEDGARALASALESPPDLILTDVMMPNLGGFELLQRLRSADQTRSIPVILLSARSGDEARIEGLHAGAEDYLTKPFSPRELVARVRTHLELAQLRREQEKQREHFYGLLMQAPIAIMVVKGPDHVLELANANFVEMVGGRDILGKTLHEAFAELPKDSPALRVLDDVYRTGRPFTAKEFFVAFGRKQTALEGAYFQFTAQALRDESGCVIGIMIVAADMTAQVLARQQIQQSEERFRGLIAQVQAGIAETDLAGKFTYTNERFQELVGRSAIELGQLRLEDITHPDDLAGDAVQFKRMVEQRAAFVTEKRYVKPDGSIVWVQNSVSRLDDREGRPRGAVTVAIDITRRKYADQALRESEERFRNMADNAPVMVWMTERDGTCTYLSQTWYELTGQTQETGLGVGWLDAVHPEDRAISQRIFVEANAKQEPFQLEYRLRRKDGEYCWAIDSGRPRIGSNGEFLGYIGSVIDITERRDGEQASALLASVVRSSQDAIITKTLDGTITSWNEGAEQMFGYSADEVLGKSILMLFPADRKDEEMQIIPKLARGERIEHYETVRQRKDGTPVDVSLTISPIKDVTGRVVGASKVARDVTDRKLVDKEREELLAEMERAVRFSEMFVGILGHDLRNPLSAITTAAALLETRADSEKIARPLSRIVVSADRMERMIAQLLDLTRIRLGGGLPLAPINVNLVEIAKVIRQELAPVYKRDIRIETFGDVSGMWDSDRLSQLLSNLIGNACQHGTSSTPVLIALDGRHSKVVHLEVRNQGAIPPELLPLLFEPLRSGEGREKREGSSGLGLGLHITQQIVLAHGGQIRVESSPDTGTRFIVDLPRNEPITAAHAFGEERVHG